MMKALVPQFGKCAEIGVLAGEFSKDLHSILKPTELVLIDLFEGNTGSGDQDGNNFKMYNLNRCYADIAAHYKSNPEVKLVKGDSVASLLAKGDNYFDMIYIDGDHSYNGCKIDLELSLQKVKPGGILMGHDYEMNFAKAKKHC
jgi:hypothetical protein